VASVHSFANQGRLGLWSSRAQRIILNSIAGAFWLPAGWRIVLFRLAGVVVGDKVLVFSGCTFRDTNVVLCDRAFVNFECMFDANQTIVLGPGVSVGARVIFAATTHELGPSSHRAGDERSEPIVVDEGTWIGSGAIIMPGVTIGRGCVIAAGAVVTSDCVPDTMYAGVPARPIRSLDPS